jgi:hypothetical protein
MRVRIRRFQGLNPTRYNPQGLVWSCLTRFRRSWFDASAPLRLPPSGSGRELPYCRGFLSPSTREVDRRNLHFLSLTLPPLGTMASADFSPRPSRAAPFQGNARSPQIRTRAFPPCGRRIYTVDSRSPFGFRGMLPVHPSTAPYIRFLFVGPEVCLPLPSDSASRRTPLCSASGSFGSRPAMGLPPSSSRPCWAYNKNAASPFPGGGVSLQIFTSSRDNTSCSPH